MQGIRKCFCFFEQSGTFKKEFKKLGIEAEDIDIANDYGETDRQLDLFDEIESGFDNKPSIFDEMRGGCIIMAFFPCVRFSKLFVMHITATAKQYKKYDDIEKAENALRMADEINRFYSLITKLVIVCLKRKIPLVIENPYGADHYLTRYWPFLPKIIDANRRENGDYYIKPTQYFFFNIEPEENLLFDEPIANYPKKNVLDQKQIDKSHISPEYARRFIRRFIYGGV